MLSEQVSEVLRGAGTVGLGALDTFSSSVANLNNRGFAVGALSKGNKIGILAFEVANTIVKGCTLKMTLGEEDIRTLKEEILVSEGVHRLVSTDPEELLLIAAADKRWTYQYIVDKPKLFVHMLRTVVCLKPFEKCQEFNVQLYICLRDLALSNIGSLFDRNELKVYADEVVRFGNHCRDPQWHGYDRIFQR